MLWVEVLRTLWETPEGPELYVNCKAAKTVQTAAVPDPVGQPCTINPEERCWMPSG